MECDCLGFSEIPETTPLFASFTEDFSRVRGYYSHTPDEAGVRAAANDARLDSDTRRAMVEVLRAQNKELGSGADVEKNIDRLANGAVAIVTGQQAGLFCGPAYTIYKALDAIRWAKNLARSNIDAVPVFWMATEDHDLTEANQVFFGERLDISRLEVPLEEDVEGRSVGRIRLGTSIYAVVEHAANLVEGQGRKQVVEALKASYQHGETFGSAFGKILVRLLGGRGLILLDPRDRRLHEVARPVYRKAAQESEAIAQDLIARGKELERRGFHAQVKVTPQSTLLFLEVEGKREPVGRKNGGFTAGNRPQSRHDLLRRIEENPEMLSANVLLRPVLQDSILPTAAYIGGPAEVAYMAQAQVVYRRILGRMPAILPRSSFTLIEPSVSRTLAKYHLDVGNVFGGRQRLRRKMEAQYLPHGLAMRFARDEKAIRKTLAGYGKPLGALDKTLLGARETAERKMLYQFRKLQGKAGRAENMRTGILDRHESEIVSALYPRHGLQERTLSLLPFLARNGMELLDRLADAADSTCRGHRLITL